MNDAPIMFNSTARQSKPTAEILLRESLHRASNDLQMMITMLAIQIRQTNNDEVRRALTDTMGRVAIIARARAAMLGSPQSLKVALHQLCAALKAQAENGSIWISCEVADDGITLSPSQISTIALVVNELSVNAIKHAFHPGDGGHVSITASTDANSDIIITVDDDGLPFPELERFKKTGMGFNLVRQLVEAIDGLIIFPEGNSKKFESGSRRRNIHAHIWIGLPVTAIAASFSASVWVG